LRGHKAIGIEHFLDLPEAAMRFLIILLSLGLLLFLLCVLPAQAESKKYHASMAPPLLTQWADSKDKRLSICFAVNKTTFATEEAVVVRCAVRNNTDVPIMILRPFGDTFYALAEGLSILGPDGCVTYQGPMKEYVLGTSSFHTLAPHGVIDETLEIPKDLFPDLGNVGLYKIEYSYFSGGYPRPEKPKNFWEGKIEPLPVVILIK
jgi:hypothetical protein